MRGSVLGEPHWCIQVSNPELSKIPHILPSTLPSLFPVYVTALYTVSARMELVAIESHLTAWVGAAEKRTDRSTQAAWDRVTFSVEILASLGQSPAYSEPYCHNAVLTGPPPVSRSAGLPVPFRSLVP